MSTVKARRHFVITAGGTREYIDPVRFISNASSGKMGYALAAAALKAGNKVTLITAPTSIKPPAGAKVVNVETSAEMFAAVRKFFPKCDCLIMAAAVSDYAPAKISKTKIKKTGKAISIQLKPTVDILRWSGLHKKRQVLVGFALEDKNLRHRAARKLKQKNLDMIIANAPSAIGAEKSALEVLTANGKWKRLPLSSKSAQAGKIVQMVSRYRTTL